MPLRRSTHEVSVGLEAVPYTARGVTLWSVNVSFVTDAGRPVRLQRRRFQTRGEALVWAERKTVLVKAGAKEPPTRAAAVAASLTTREALTRIMAWWRDAGRKKESTLFIDGHALEKHLFPTLGRVPWSVLSQEHVEALVQAARDRPTPRHLSVLKAARRDSKRAGLDPPKVLLEVPRRPSNDRTDFLPASELEKVCAWPYLQSNDFIVESGCELPETASGLRRNRAASNRPDALSVNPEHGLGSGQDLVVNRLF